MKHCVICVFFVFLATSLLPPTETAAREPLTVAVAAGFMEPFRKLAHCFEQSEGSPVRATFASTGSLYSQIERGAPYDMYFAADETQPSLLHEAGLARRPFVYALGRLVLWSSYGKFCAYDTWQEALLNGRGLPISMVNPVTGPYGSAALEALESENLAEALQKRLVIAQTVAQAFQYAATGAVEAGFCTQAVLESEAGRKGCFYDIPQAPPVIMAACILERTEKLDTAERFAAFISSPEGQQIKEMYGFQ